MAHTPVGHVRSDCRRAADMLSRRRIGAATAAAWVVSTTPAARAATRARGPIITLAAAWDNARGAHHVGVLEVATSTGRPIRVRHALVVPTRAHVVAPDRDGAIVAVARRPGAWMLRWHPGEPAARATWRWSETDRSFAGHVVPDGLDALLCTETDAATGAGLLVRRDRRSLEVLDEWATGGVDPHDVLALPESGGWLVANGGVQTRPESGRMKLDRSAMDSSLVHIDVQGRTTGQWRAADRRLSLRHLARHASGIVGVAMQAEHDAAEARRAAPLLALWDRQGLRLALDTVSLEGYAGDIATYAGGFVLSATRAGRVVVANVEGSLVANHALEQACAVVTHGRSAWVASGHDACVVVTSGSRPSFRASPPGLFVDNHWEVMTT
jgi:hypothetical protein